MFTSEKSSTFPKTGKIFVGSKNEADFIYREIFDSEDYTGGGINLKEGDIIFDVGANIGIFSLFADIECSNKCAIYAFEPVPHNFKLLQKNISFHGLNDRVKLFNTGLTHLNGPDEAQFIYYPEMSGNSTMRPSEKEALYEKADPDNIIKMLKVTDAVSYWLLMALYPFRKHLVRWKLKQSLKGQEVTCSLTTLSDMFQKENIKKVDLLKN